jgi:hypothetical protein
MEARQPGRLELLLATASTLLAVWYMLPPHEQQAAKMRTLRLLHRLAGRLAAQEGHAGMADELAGRDFQRYGLAYRLSLARDRIGQVLEGMLP